jgi:glycosyltransferase involved in cell wall biosynthesis
MQKEKIIFANRKECFSKPGGDTVQMLKTKEYLEKKYNIEIEICLDSKGVLENKEAKIVHIFNIQTIDETLEFINAAKKSNKKVALTPIHWDYSHAIYAKYLSFLNIYLTNDFFKHFKNPVIKLFNIFILITPSLRKKYSDYLQKGLIGTKKYREKRKQALIDADLIISNSEEELEIYSNIFQITKNFLKEKSCIIPNAVDTDLFDANKNIDNNIDLPKDFILQVGRIEPAKNQINVVKALYKRPDIPIVFIGMPIDEKYYKNLYNIAQKRGNVFFIQNVKQEELINYYKKAKVHILPSFAETTGLVSLEALFSGCQIITSSREFCPIKTYNFDQYGFTCNPYDPKSIEKAVDQAISSPKNIKTDSSYKIKFSYNNAADLTFKAYSSILKNEDLDYTVQCMQN